jgi:predicted nucleic acid-binding Zn ribbon protein
MADNGPEPLAEILGRLFALRGWGRQQDQGRIEAVWREIVGAKLAAAARGLGLKRGIFEVRVENPVLLQELTGFRKRELLAALQAKLGAERVKDLRFRLGS